MFRRMLIVGVALAALAGNASFASTDGTGFDTSDCTIADPMPGSGTVRVAGPAPYYPFVDGGGAPLTTPAQAAINASQPGDAVLLLPGTYREGLRVGTFRDGDGNVVGEFGSGNIRIRGLDRNGVEFDGAKETVGGVSYPQLEVGIDIREADNVLVENLTVHNYRRHGVFWWHVKGYWGRWLTAYNMGLYGVYAFDSRCGQIDNSYGSGNADSAFYIGECFPCDAVITDIVAEGNALGYSGTNAGGDLVLQNSIWRDNGLGIVPNSLDGEDRPPQRGITIKWNTIVDNNNREAPGVSLAGTYFGGGIVIAGGVNNEVYGNTVTDHELGGIVLSPLPDQNLWVPSGNSIWGNTVTHSEDQPDSLDLAQSAASGFGNCWADNVFATSAPAMIEDIYSCGMPTTPAGGDPRVELSLVFGAAGLNGRDAQDWRTWPAPAAQDNFRDRKCDGDHPVHSQDCTVDRWLPALGLYNS